MDILLHETSQDIDLTPESFRIYFRQNSEPSNPYPNPYHEFMLDIADSQDITAFVTRCYINESTTQYDGSVGRLTVTVVQLTEEGGQRFVDFMKSARNRDYGLKFYREVLHWSRWPIFGAYPRTVDF